MIFKLKPREQYKDGDTRFIRSYCWFPTRIGDEMLWLEDVIIKQEVTWMYFEADEWYVWKNISYTLVDKK